MTNQLAIVIGVTVAAFVGIDLTLYDGEMMLFLAKKLYWFIDWLAFWR